MSKTSEAVFETVRSIPLGRCASYGAVGRALDAPISGLIVGHILSHCDSDIPWWRVVGRDGSLLIARREPGMAIEQARRLELEGIAVQDGRVSLELLVADL